MTMTTPRGPESTVVRMVGNAMHIQNIEVETGWTVDEIKALAMRNGYALDAASRRFRRAPQPKPAPVGIVRTSQTSTGAADTGQPTSDPSHDRDTNSGRGGEPSPSAPVLPEVPETTAAAEQLVDQVKRRKSGLTTLDLHALDRAVATIVPPDWHTYLVGTAHTSSSYRDVDVRTILADDEFDAVFATRPDLWDAWCFAAGAWLKAATGLPIDYQVQRRTEANEKYDGPRSPVGSVARTRIHGRRYAGGGDATKFTADGAQQEPSSPAKRSGNYPTGPRITHGASQSQIRDWARTQGLDVNPRGTVRRGIADAYAAAHPQETP